jgi:hypothetical protein
VFARHDASGYRCPPTIAEGVSDVFAELARSGVTDVVISTDIPLRLDGRQRSGVKPDDPGVAVWFRRNGELRCIAVDAFDTVAANLRAIALVIEGVRRMERYGCAGLLARAVTALTYAPALPQSAGEGRRAWHDVLGVAPGAPQDVVEAAYKVLARTRHPDAGGSRAEWDELARAIEEAREAENRQ